LSSKNQKKEDKHTLLKKREDLKMPKIMNALKKTVNLNWMKASVIAILTIFIAGILTWISGIISSFSVTFSVILSLIFAFFVIRFALEYRKGKENIVNTLTYFILAGIFAELVILFIPNLIGLFSFNLLTIPVTIAGASILLGSLFLSEAITSNFM